MTNVMHLASILSTFPSCQAIFHQHQPMVSMHHSSFSMPVVAQIIVTFYCPTHLRNYMADTQIWLDNTRKMCVKCLLILSVETIFIFDGFGDGQIKKIS